jgi:RNA polymerase sigma-70 factor (ECF subfamily)
VITVQIAGPTSGITRGFVKTRSSRTGSIVPKIASDGEPKVSDDAAFAELLAQAQAGNDAAMEVLFLELHPRLTRFLHANEQRVADDLAGEVWMAVARGLREFEGDAAGFRAWVFSIARRRIADYRRRGVRRKTDPVETSHFEALAAGDDPESVAMDLMSGQKAADLVIANLPPDHAEVVLLRVLADLDVDQVAEVMGKSANWVRVTQHRALQRLAQRLGPRIDVIR